MIFEGNQTVELLLQEHEEVKQLRKKVKRIQKLCYKTSEKMKQINNNSDRVICLHLFLAEVCLVVVPQTNDIDKSSSGGVSESEK